MMPNAHTEPEAVLICTRGYARRTDGEPRTRLMQALRRLLFCGVLRLGIVRLLDERVGSAGTTAEGLRSRTSRRPRSWQVITGPSSALVAVAVYLECPT